MHENTRKTQSYKREKKKKETKKKKRENTLLKLFFIYKNIPTLREAPIYIKSTLLIIKDTLR